jgi:hypothetical protein
MYRIRSLELDLGAGERAREAQREQQPVGRN